MREKAVLVKLKDVVTLYTLIFLAWGLYRFLFRMPEEIEEIVLKPIIWLGPLCWFLYKEKASLASVGWSSKNIFKSLYFGLLLGFFFVILGFVSHLVKYQKISFAKLPEMNTPELFLVALGLSVMTALSEETVFRGYFFNRLLEVLKDEWWANFVSSAAWVFIHLPIAIFVFYYNLPQTVVFLFLVFLFGFGSAFVFARTRTIVASILLHVFWSWPIILFR